MSHKIIPSAQNKISVIGAAIGDAAGIKGCELGPKCIQQSSLNNTLTVPLDWRDIVDFPHQSPKDEIFANVQVFSKQLAIKTSQMSKENTPFLVIGGDHSCAIGTWAGVSHAINDESDLGLIWIDAHLDAHTPETSASGNIHGMPVAALLGFGDSRLSNILTPGPTLKPENIILMGIRSYEPEEHALLASLGVKIYTIDQVHEQGLHIIMQQSIDYLESKVNHFGISLDLDALDPENVPGVGTPVENGIKAKDLTNVFSQMSKDKLLCIEIAEYNPLLGKNHKTQKTIFAIIEALCA